MAVFEDEKKEPVGLKLGSDNMANQTFENEKEKQAPPKREGAKVQDVEFKKLVKRIGGTGDFIKFNAAACNGCGVCSKLCPMNIWGLKDGKAVLASDYADRCVECGSCGVACEKNAIDFSYPRGGTGVIWEFG